MNATTLLKGSGMWGIGEEEYRWTEEGAMLGWKIECGMDYVG